MFYSAFIYIADSPVLQIRKCWLLLGCLCLSSCANENFFQEDARATAAELAEKAPAGPDSVWAVAGRHYDRNGFHRFFWGDHNRAIWATPVKVPVFRLDSIYGGLTVEEKGGGFQTTSFTLRGSRGRLFALRSIDKDPLEVLPPFWQKTFVANIVRDQTAAANPYGALVVPVLAEAAGIYHANPAIYYISPSDTSFGEYAPAVQGKLFLLQEKFESPADLTPAFGAATDFADSEDALKNRYEHNTFRFDQEAFARARLLDLLVGDWDRHKGQWEWAVEKKGAEHIYLPVPKDRDQVFLQMGDGLIPSIATSKFLVRKFHSFDEDVDDVKAYMINSAFLDARLLHELSLHEWQQIARNMQASLTDNVLERAARRLPGPVYDKVGKQITENLKSRRDRLPEVAETMYKMLAEEVTIPGTDAEEKFVVRRHGDGQTEVTLYSIGSPRAPARRLYRRIFNRKETKQITLHGLAGDDIFLVKGQAEDGILVNLNGGLGEDTFTDSSAVEGWKHMTRIYDTERGNDFYFGTEAKDMTTDDVRVHAYDREGN
ncbi:hypothetical protein [Pontibacter russatus]|uniref:hypothetical protein n=1 Tax=Pontibacter russatus TaxID=2694929 RepID=UPI00137B809D|nr:hypothetical protein [Pontibacter russatus]